MHVEWSLALRNLLRNRRRSLSTLIALAIGLTAILLFRGFQANLASTMLTAAVRAGGHLQVQHKDYFLYGGGNPTAYAMTSYDDILRAIRSDAELGPMVAVATPMLRFGGLAGNFDAGISRTVIGTGYIAEDVSRMRGWNEYGIPVVRPRFRLESSAPDSAIVGIGVARVLQLCGALAISECPAPEAPAKVGSPPSGKSGPTLPGDIAGLALAEHASTRQTSAAARGARIELLASGATGAPNVASLNVVAAEDQVFKELDEVSVIVHLKQAQQLIFGRGAARVTAIMVMLHQSADRDAAAKRLRELIDTSSDGRNLIVRTFAELNPFYAQSETLFDFIFAFIFLLIGGIVLFTVSNTMNTAVVERTVEIGTLRAIGLRRGGIRRLFVIEGFMLGCAGAAVGVVAAWAIGDVVNRAGIRWLPPGSSELLPLQLRVFGQPLWLLACSVSLAAIATASAWWPARRAAKLGIVDALRHV